MIRFALLVAASLSLPLTANAADTYKVDPGHSQVLFTTTYFGHSHFTGRFNGFSGTIVDGTSIELTVEIGSVDTGIDKRDGHLKAPDFFNAKQFPQATFKSTAWKKTGDNTWDVTGDFTLRGKTKSVTAKITKVGTGKDPKGNERGGFDAVLSIDRHDFGVDYGKGGLGAKAEIKAQITALKQG